MNNHNRLFDRELPLDYLEEWTHTLAQPSAQTSQVGQTLSVMIFRLGSERFALPVSILQEVTRPVPVHTLPHRTTDLFLGLVNHRGEILPCVSLSQFLQVEMPIDPTYSRLNLRRMMVIGSIDSRWVFPVDEVYRVHRMNSDELQDPPVVVTQASQAYTAGMIDWHDEKVNYLDAGFLLDSLDRRLL
jgi:chemotaxis-related protein WspD